MSKRISKFKYNKINNTEILSDDVNDVKINELDIPEFNIETDISDNSFIVLFGRRGSGKSFLGRRIMKRFGDIPKIKIICPSETVNGDYGKYVPGICIDDDYKSEVLEEIFLDQEEIINRIKDIKENKDKLKEQIEILESQIKKYSKAIDLGKIKQDIGKECIIKINNKIKLIDDKIYNINEILDNLDPRVLYVADDIMFKKESPLLDEQFRKLVFNGRHYKITGLYMSQYPLGVPKNMRGCIDYVFILAEDSESSRDLLYENYGKGIFSNKLLFYEIMDKCTVNRQALVLKMTKTNDSDQIKVAATNDLDRIKGKVFYYKADDIGDFKWKNKILWDIHYEYYDKNYRKRAIEERRYNLKTKNIKMPKKKECGVNIKLIPTKKKQSLLKYNDHNNQQEKILSNDNKKTEKNIHVYDTNVNYDKYKKTINFVLNDPI